MRWGGRGPRAHPASGCPPSSFLPYWKGQDDSWKTQRPLLHVPVTSAARSRVAGGGAAQGSRCTRRLPDFLPGTDATWALLETSAGLVTSQDFRTQLLTGYPVAEVVSPQASHPGRRGPRYRSCWHRPIPTNPADIPRAQGQPWPTRLCMQFPPCLTIPTGQSSP